VAERQATAELLTKERDEQAKAAAELLTRNDELSQRDYQTKLAMARKAQLEQLAEDGNETDVFKANPKVQIEMVIPANDKLSRHAAYHRDVEVMLDRKHDPIDTRNPELKTQNQKHAVNRNEQMNPLKEREPIIICTHHKAGSAFNVKLFENISQEFNKSLWTKFYDPVHPTGEWEICLHQHSRVLEILPGMNFKGWHCIRNPKALIFSAALYHEKCNEPWVDVPLYGFSSNTFFAASDGRLYNIIKDPTVPIVVKKIIMNADYTGETPDGFIHFPSTYQMQGKTYRQFLADLPTIEEKVKFEMNAYSRGVINDMLTFPDDERFLRIHFESISKDTKMRMLHDAFIFLGFQGKELIKCLDIASNHCLWNIGKETIKKHATTGMSDEWKNIFIGSLLNEYNKLFRGAEETLGYLNN